MNYRLTYLAFLNNNNHNIIYVYIHQCFDPLKSLDSRVYSYSKAGFQYIIKG